MSAEILRKAAALTRAAAEKCCQCTDGHHDWMRVYGTEGDVRISRDAAFAVADLLETVAANLSARQAHPDHPFDADGYVSALEVARAYLGGDE